MRRRTLICTILITAALAILVLWFDLKLSRTSPLRFGVTTVTNEFGFPVAQLNFTNRSNVSIHLMLQTEVLADEWRKEYGIKTFSVGPRSTSHTVCGHPIAEGKWRVAVTWTVVPPANRIYYFISRHCSPVVQYFQRKHCEFTVPIEAWQPPELRSAYK